MRNVTVLKITLLALVLLFEVGGPTAFADEGRPQVMILGTFHFAQPKRDLINVGTDDILGERRQREIEDVVTRLAKFAPTMIALELLPEDAEGYNARYRAYRDEGAPLGDNERDQIGMRLAARLKHSQLFGVDYKRLGMDISAVMAAGAESGQTALLERLQADFQSIEHTLRTEQGPERTIREMLIFHNGPWAEAGNAGYLRMAILGSQESPVGADVISAWYDRNLHIYANIARLAADPDDRILVIYGSGHRDQLTDFFEESPDFDLVSPLDYLQ